MDPEGGRGRVGRNHGGRFEGSHDVRREPTFDLNPNKVETSRERDKKGEFYILSIILFVVPRVGMYDKQLRILIGTSPVISYWSMN